MFLARSMRPWWWGLIVSALVLLLVGGGCGGGSQEEGGKDTAATGPVKILYEDDAIKPENRDAVDQIRKSGVLERMADWTNKVVALPYGIEVRVTDELPKGVDDQSTEPDGRTIWVPEAWLTDTHDTLKKVVEEINSEGGPPAVFPKEKFNADDLNVLANQYILATRWATRCRASSCFRSRALRR